MWQREVSLCLLLALVVAVSGCSTAAVRDVELPLSSVDISQRYDSVVLPVDTDPEIAQVVAVYVSDTSPEMLPSAVITGIGDGSLEIDGKRVATTRVFVTADRDDEYYFQGYFDITVDDGYVRGALNLVAR